MIDVKLIALDLDDTLLNDERQISDENVAALQDCVKRGIYVVLCSGRADAAILPFVRRLDIAGSEYGRFIIGMNGCSIFDLHLRQQIDSRLVDSEILLRANQIAEEAGLRTEVYTPDVIYYGEETKWTRLDVDLCGLKGEVVPNYKDFLKKPFMKMLVPGEPELLLKLQETLRQEFASRAAIFTSKPYFLEIIPQDAGKGEAIVWLANRLGFGAEKTMCFGDSMNDENMFLRCKYGVAMINGLDYIKQIATHVTEKSNNESGIADFLRKNVF